MNFKIYYPKCRSDLFTYTIILITIIFFVSTYSFADERKFIRALYLPIADNYTGIIAFEKYRDKMVFADFSLERMDSWPEMRAYFISGEVDMAFITAPLAMDMFLENPDFKCVSLMNRDGGAMAINDLLNTYVKLSSNRKDRKPDNRVADAFARIKKEMGNPSKCAVSSLLSVDTVILYKYLNDHGKTLSIERDKIADVIVYPIDPIKSPSFIKENNSRMNPVSFEQSIPWADVVETNKFGYLAWYSKDVIIWPNGHVNCIAVATVSCIQNKKEALKEVITYLHQAGMDIEAARTKGGRDMVDLIDTIRLHIPEHNEEAIVQSLRSDVNVINYKNLNVDINGLKFIMKLAIDAGIMKQNIDMEKFVDQNFSTNISTSHFFINN
ncbi:MAG: ABC transporter substrate-binding protein [Desulfobacterales bacterium]|nr:ABC transporter substrate-binding protein [Desulfobacterales bacterium]